MSEDRVIALEKALQSVLVSARYQGLDLDQLCEGAIQTLRSSVGVGWEKAMGLDKAMAEIEKAKNEIAIR